MQGRVKRTALAVVDHSHGGFLRIGLFIAVLADQCVIDIGHGDDLSGNGDLLPSETVWIALTVPAFVVQRQISMAYLTSRSS